MMAPTVGLRLCLSLQWADLLTPRSERP